MSLAILLTSNIKFANMQRYDIIIRKGNYRIPRPGSYRVISHRHILFSNEYNYLPILCRNGSFTRRSTDRYYIEVASTDASYLIEVMACFFLSVRKHPIRQWPSRLPAFPMVFKNYIWKVYNSAVIQILSSFVHASFLTYKYVLRSRIIYILSQFGQTFIKHFLNQTNRKERVRVFTQRLSLSASLHKCICYIWR